MRSETITKNDLTKILNKILMLDGVDMTESEVTEFIDSLNLTAANAVDYIVEQSTDGIWTYRKWNSGVAECWGKYTQTITGTTGWGSIYYTTPTAQIDYPTSLFTDSPTVNASNISSATQGSVAFSGNNATRLAVYVIRGASASSSSSVIYSIYAIGTWK